MKKIVISVNLMITVMSACGMCGLNEVGQNRYSANFQNIKQCGQSMKRSAITDSWEILPEPSSECPSTNEVSLAMSQGEGKHLFSQGSLTKACFDKVVAVDSQLSNWGQSHPYIVKYAKNAAKIGVGVASRYFGLTLGQKLFRGVGGKLIKSTFGIIKNPDVGEILITYLIQQGYSEQEVNEYVRAIQGLGGKLLVVSDILLFDGDPVAITKNLAKPVITDFLVRQGYSESSTGKCVDIVFALGRVLVNNRVRLVNAQ